MSSVTEVSTGQALDAMKAAMTKTVVEQQGQIALQQIQAVAQSPQQTSPTIPGEQIGKTINTTA